MSGKNYVQNYQRVPAESLKKGEPEVTVSRSPPLTSNPANRGWWERMEADNETGALLVWLWLLHNAAGLRQGFFRKQVTCLGISSQLQNMLNRQWHNHLVQKVNARLLCRVSTAGNV